MNGQIAGRWGAGVGRHVHRWTDRKWMSTWWHAVVVRWVRGSCDGQWASKAASEFLQGKSSL